MSKSEPNLPRGGIHPRDAKELTANRPIEAMPVPDEVNILLHQHSGSPCRAIVYKGARVVEGDLIGNVKAGFGASVHASISGTVTDIGISPHAVHVEVPSVTIRRDPEAERKVYAPSKWRQLSREQILEKIKKAGLVGMGGAGFPTHVKLAVPPSVKVDKLILNGSECEPYLNCDNRTMIEFPDEIMEGAKIILAVLGIRECHIGIESNKKEAMDILHKAARENVSDDFRVSIHALEPMYPQGSEKHLIQSITGRKVPPFGLPYDVGVIVINVSTTKAIYDAVVLGKPLYERVITVSGKAIVRPANLLVRVGTRLKDIIEYLGGTTDNLARIVMGGPMMGFAIFTLYMPVTKVTSGVLLLSNEEVDSRPHSQCIRCGWCFEVCPMGLSPGEIGIYVESGRWQDSVRLGVLECLECGCCAYVCPAKRPLVQFCRIGKTKARK